MAAKAERDSERRQGEASREEEREESKVRSKCRQAEEWQGRGWVPDTVGTLLLGHQSHQNPVVLSRGDKCDCGSQETWPGGHRCM